MPLMWRLPTLPSTRGEWRPWLSAWAAVRAAGKRVRGRLPTLPARGGWALYTLACFLLFLFLTFPSDLLLRRIVAALAAESPVRVRYATGDLTWWGEGRFSDVTVENPLPGMPTLQASRLTLTPSFIGLLRGHLSPLTVDARLYGGTVRGTVRKEGEGFAVQFVIDRLALERWPFPRPWDQGRVAGRLTADGELQGNAFTPHALNGSLRATLTDGLLRSGTIAGMPVPALQSIRVHLHTTIADGRTEITELVLDADGVEATLQGTVVLRTPLERSGLDLRLTTKVTGSPPPALTALLSLLPVSPHSPHERRAVISGSLATPIVR
ncbi:MAG: type II secretion system protein GspN [Thermodesulfobacteriota bacterium]